MDGGKAWISFEDETTLTFDELSIVNGAHVAFESPAENQAARTVTINKLMGSDVIDKSSIGTVHVGPQVSAVVISSDYYLPVNLKVHKDGFLSLPDRLHLFNSNSAVNGTVHGAQELSLVESVLMLGENAQSPGEGRVKIHSLAVMSSAKLILIGKQVLEGDKLQVGPGGQVICRQATFTFTTVIVDEGGHLNGNGQGNSDSRK